MAVHATRPLKNVPAFKRDSSSRKTKNLTAGIYGIFRGLNFESDAEIGQKGAFFKGLVKVSRFRWDPGTARMTM